MVDITIIEELEPAEVELAWRLLLRGQTPHGYEGSPYEDIQCGFDQGDWPCDQACDAPIHEMWEATTSGASLEEWMPAITDADMWAYVKGEGLAISLMYIPREGFVALCQGQPAVKHAQREIALVRCVLAAQAGLVGE